MGRVTAALVVFLVLVVQVAAAEAPVDAVNGYRSARGLPALQWSPALAAGAQAWSDHLADTHSLSHSHTLPAGWSVVAENVGWGPSTRAVERAFEASPAHSHNLAGPYSRFGVGVAVRDGLVWVTQWLGTPAAATPAPPPAKATTTTSTRGTCR